MKVHLLVIDPQNDFCDPKGSLFVPGANEDMDRLASMLNRLVDKIDDIHVTLDSHRTVDVAHPVFWKNSAGNHPDPFTIITVQDVENGKWQTTNPGFASRGLEYVKSLEANNRYALCIWPEHCIIGSYGHAIYPALADELINWERKRFGVVNYVTKGSNLFTEHYSAVQADVVDPEDPSTMLNTDLLDVIKSADIIALSGEALSHCVKFTVEDIANNFGDENIKKLVLLRDTCSSVPGFEQNGEDFVNAMIARGMKVENSVDFLK